MKRFLAAFIILVSLTHCAGVAGIAPAKAQVQADRAVILSADVYDVVMSSLGALYRAGKLSNADRDVAVHWANIYRASALKVLAREPGYDVADDVTKMQSALAAIKAMVGGIR